jgi:hypothetical protein
MVAKAWHYLGAPSFAVQRFRLSIFPLFFALLTALLASPLARAGVGVVLNESLHESMDRITGTGHTAVYFSNICPESPIKLRLCRSGEMGSVMSIYINIGEDHPYGWNIVPLSIYLYGVEDPQDRPILGTYKIKRLLEERYRESYLSAYCATVACQTSPKAEWREMVAATLIRSVYIFALDTSTEQDLQLITEFNDSVNKNRFNGVRRNCADFTRTVINTYFPHAVNRDVLNDFGMTSPKAVARTFTRYAFRHPESNFRVLHFAQVPGTIKRSSEVRAGTEQLVRSKKFLVPMILFAGHELPFVAASYLLTGRFNPEHTFEKFPASDFAIDNAAPPAELQAAVTTEARLQLVGTTNEWKEYHQAYDSTVEQNRDVIDHHELTHFFNFLDQAGTASLDANGSVWMELSDNGEPLRVGLSANNALARDSNPQLAYKFLLARTGSVLKSPKHSRETMQEFKQDWANLQHASTQMNSISSVNATPWNANRDKVSFRNTEDWGLAQLPW